jgi:hypothetical protein
LNFFSNNQPVKITFDKSIAIKFCDNQPSKKKQKTWYPAWFSKMWEMGILISRRLLEIGPGTGTDGSSHKTVRTGQDRLLHATYGINYFHMPSHKYEDLDNQVFKCDHVVALWWPADQKQLFSFIGPYTVGCTSSTVPCTDRCTSTLYILLNSGCLFDWYAFINPTFFFSLPFWKIWLIFAHKEQKSF